MAVYDDYTLADHRFQAAKATGHKTGNAFEVTGGNITGLLSGVALIGLGAFALGFAGYCILKIATHPWGV